ncbi:MAG: protein BatD [Deltaproteobacteria bacterium]|nr:protein BatD [Deltaproteobacteria bacterium]
MSARDAIASLLAPVAATLVVCTSLGAAAGIKVTAELDRNHVSLGQRAMLTVTVQGSQDAGNPDLGDMQGMQVLSAGRSTNVSIVNGSMTVVVSDRFVITPIKEGKLTIGPITVPVGGTKYSAGTLELDVSPGGNSNSAQGQGRGRAGPVQQEQVGNEGGSPVFVTARVSNNNPFQGEQVIYTFRFYRAVRVAGADLAMPEFDGFVSEDLGKQRDYQTVIKGRTYLVSEIRKALFPQEVGKVTIKAAKLTVKVAVRDRRRRRGNPFDDFFNDDFFNSPIDDFFGGTRLQTKVLSTGPVEMDVKPLPSEPRDFSGLVGDFGLKASLSKNEIKLGDSATLTLVVKGTGDVRAIPDPWRNTLDDFKVYPDKPTVRINRNGSRISGSKIFREALVPLKAGRLQVPRIYYKFFDPGAGQFKVASVGPFDINVLPSKGKEELKLTEVVSPLGGKVAVKVLGTDILPIHEGLNGLESQAVDISSLIPALFGIFLSPMVFLIVLLGRKRSRRLEEDKALRRRKSALSNAKKNLYVAARMASKGEKDKSLEMVSRTIKEYLGDMLNTGGGALTAYEADTILRELAVPGEKVKPVVGLLSELEGILYGGGTPGDSAQDAPKRALKAIKRLHRHLAKLGGKRR